jgi:cell division protein YceG involved in septum cleavage
MMGEDIRDIKDVVGVFDWGLFLFIVLVIVLVIASLIIIYRYWQTQKSKDKKQIVKIPEKTFQQIATEKLQALDPVAYYEKGLIKEYYIDLTDIIRHFLEGNYLIDALDRTSIEIVNELERVERDFSKVKLIDSFFLEADLVKFAKNRPILAIMRDAKKTGEKIVR